MRDNHARSCALSERFLDLAWPGVVREREEDIEPREISACVIAKHERAPFDRGQLLDEVCFRLLRNRVQRWIRLDTGRCAKQRRDQRDAARKVPASLAKDREL